MLACVFVLTADLKPTFFIYWAITHVHTSTHTNTHMHTHTHRAVWWLETILLMAPYNNHFPLTVLKEEGVRNRGDLKTLYLEVCYWGSATYLLCLCSTLSGSACRRAVTWQQVRYSSLTVCFYKEKRKILMCVRVCLCVYTYMHMNISQQTWCSMQIMCYAFNQKFNKKSAF